MSDRQKHDAQNLVTLLVQYVEHLIQVGKLDPWTFLLLALIQLETVQYLPIVNGDIADCTRFKQIDHRIRVWLRRTFESTCTPPWRSSSAPGATSPRGCAPSCAALAL